MYRSSLLLGIFLASSLILDLTGLGGLPGAYAPAGIALGIIDNIFTNSRGNTLADISIAFYK
jgi:hypothetical protein